MNAEGTSGMNFTGERYVPGVKGNIELEHRHRYLLARELCHGKDVLDLASGEGYGSAMLSSVANCVVGVDIAHDAVQHSQRAYVRQNLRFMVGSCADIPLPDASIDVVVSFETLEHHDQHDEMMAEVKRVLRPDGLLIVSMPDKYRYSDVPGYKNEFLVKELYHHEFAGLLRRHFTNASFYGQRVAFGSVVVGKGPNVRLAKIHEEGTALACSDEMIDAVYWIGLASNAALPAFGSGFLEQAVGNSETVREYTQALSQLDAKLAALNHVLSDRDSQIAHLNLALKEKEHEKLRGGGPVVNRPRQRIGPRDDDRAGYHGLAGLGILPPVPQARQCARENQKKLPCINSVPDSLGAKKDGMPQDQHETR